MKSSVRCFAASPSLVNVREVQLDALTDLLPITHDSATVQQYRARMLEGDLFPPIAVVPWFGRLIIADGHKRYQAARPLTGEPVAVEIWGLRGLLRDQWRQARSNSAKNVRIASNLFVNPSESARLARATLLHWIRVARCLRLLLPRARSETR